MYVHSGHRTYDYAKSVVQGGLHALCWPMRGGEYVDPCVESDWIGLHTSIVYMCYIGVRNVLYMFVYVLVL